MTKIIFIIGLFVGFILGTLLAIWINLSNIAQAQTQVTAHVVESDLRSCLEQHCSQYDF